MILADAPIRARLMQIYEAEVIPGFAARGMRDAASAYVSSTMERFENPFLQPSPAGYRGEPSDQDRAAGPGLHRLGP